MCALFAACSGGGVCGGCGLPNPLPTLVAAGLNGSVQYVTGGSFGTGFTYSAAAAGDRVVFSCGCSAQAGAASTVANGSLVIVQSSTATPSAPAPEYTIVPGRNYLVVAQGPASQAWTMQFAGRLPSHNLFLGASGANDVFTAAVSLYVYLNADTTSTAFDDWNFNALAGWYGHLQKSPNVQETALLNDIAAQSAAGQPLYPAAPSWDPSQPTNPLITADIAAVKASADAYLPTPCPGQMCTGTPNP